MGSSLIKDRTHVSVIIRQIFYYWATREAQRSVLKQVRMLWFCSVSIEACGPEACLVSGAGMGGGEQDWDEYLGPRYLVKWVVHVRAAGDGLGGDVDGIPDLIGAWLLWRSFGTLFLWLEATKANKGGALKLLWFLSNHSCRWVGGQGRPHRCFVWKLLFPLERVMIFIYQQEQTHVIPGWEGE